ncbi:MAG TPA: flagellar filament capping protein FliD [Bacillales bacterium]
MSDLLRVTGLASGINTEQIIDKLMKAERIPLINLKQQQQILEWRRDDYREMNKLLLDLRNSVFDLGLQSSFSTKQAVSTDESRLTATADGSAGNVSYTISGGANGASLATSASNNSTSAITDSSFDPEASLWSMKDKFNNAITWDKKATTESITAGKDQTSFSLAHGAIDDGSSGTSPAPAITVTSADGSVTTSYTVYTDKSSFDAASGQKVLLDTETGELTFGSGLAEGSVVSADYTYNAISFGITTYDESGQANAYPPSDQPGLFTFDGSKSLNDILDVVNNSGAGVNMFYDKATQEISVTRTETGDFNVGTAASGNEEMTFSGAFLTTNLKLDETQESGGTDASFTINGLATTRHSNTFTINGVTFHLKSAIPSGESVSVNISTDTDQIFDKVKAFVDLYNETIQKINGELNEERYRDYKPLTDAQREEFSEHEAELWREKAKSGLLANDTILSGGLGQMRIDIYSEVEGVGNPDYNQLAEIGITVSSDYREHGKLVLNDDKLRAAIAADPDAVMELFTSNSDDFSKKGIADRLESTLENTMERIEQKAGNSGMTEVQFFLGRRLDDIGEQIDDFQNHLSQIEDRYYRQFTAMEQAIQRANQQSAFIMSSIAGK